MTDTLVAERPIPAPPVIERPVRHENAFPDDVRKSLYEFLNTPGWETGWKSNSRHDGHSFLHKHYAGHRRKGGDNDKPYDCESELLGNAPIIHGAWRRVRDKVFAGHTLVRCYANGMAYGMDGTVHCDAHEAGNYTAIYYPHERWSPNWGGETMFYNQRETRVMHCLSPVPNTIVVFDGRMPHRANGVTRTYAGLRITLMFKTEKPNAVTV